MNNITENYKKRLKEVFQKYKGELRGIRANNPTTALVEDIEVDYYGSKTLLSHLASIQIKPPREIIIQIWDKGAIKSVSDAIRSSALGLSSNAEGDTIRIFMPELSKERRNELIKYVKKIVEKFKIEIRNTRDNVNKEIEKIEKLNQITEDEKYSFKKETQKETDDINKKIEELFKEKEEKIKG